MDGIIYKYTNNINGKVYIGQTIHPEKRYREHKNCKKNDYFHTSIRKYGFDNFSYEVIIKAQSKEKERLFFILNCLERFYIKLYKSNNSLYGYNLTSGGEGRRDSYVSEETRAKLSIASRNRICKDETRLKLSLIKKGKKLKEETKKKIAAAHLGKSFKDKKVSQYSLDGEFIKTFDSMKKAAEANGNCSRSHISECCRGLRKHFKRFIWKFE